jgi:hypothetical protein
MEEAEDTPESVSNAVQSAAEAIEAIEQDLARTRMPRWPRTLYSRLTSLYGTIGGFTEAPGPSQMERLEALATELNGYLENLNTFIDEEIPSLNQTIRQGNVPRIIPAQRVDLP